MYFSIYTQKGIYYKELIYAIMEPEKSHEILTANWRHRKTSSVVHSV